MLTAIIVPTLEEVDNIVPLVKQIEHTKVPFSEIIFVDDGSTDGTRDKIRGRTLARRVRLIARDGAGRGLAGAIVAGANCSTGGVLVVREVELSDLAGATAALLQPVLADEA